MCNYQLHHIVLVILIPSGVHIKVLTSLSLHYITHNHYLHSHNSNNRVLNNNIFNMESIMLTILIIMCIVLLIGKNAAAAAVAGSN